jgi:hypothetical protein
MDIQSEFVHTLQDQAGLDPATADKVAHVTMDFGKQHAPELISEYAPEPFKSMAPAGSGGDVAREAVDEAGREAGGGGGSLISRLFGGGTGH